MAYALVNVFGEILDGFFPSRKDATDANNKDWQGHLDVRYVSTSERF